MIPEPDRTELARRVFDAVICPEHSNAIHALNDWCNTIAGLGGYLGCSALCIESHLPPLADHLSAIGFLIERSARIAVLLANCVEADIVRAKRGEQS